MRRFPLARLAVVLVVLLPGTAAWAGQQQRWVITDLGTLSGKAGYQSRATAINEVGAVIGQSEGAGLFTARGFVWRRGNLIGIGTLGGSGDYANSDTSAINRVGQVIGDAYVKAGNQHGFLWQNRKMTDLGVLPGSDDSHAAVLDDRGDVFGTSNSNPDRVFLWRKGATTDLGAPPAPGPRPQGYVWTQVSATNERGEIVGWTETDGISQVPTDQRAFVWRNHKMTALTPMSRRSLATDINDRGQIVGAITTKSGGKRAFLWWRGKAVDLGTLPGWANSEAVAINNHGQVIGNASNGVIIRDGSTPVFAAGRAFVWQNGQMIDLGTLGGKGSYAFAINAASQVVGASFTADGKEHAFLWQKGQMSDLGTLPGGEARAVDINSKGVIVGSSATAAGHTHAVLWTRRGG